MYVWVLRIPFLDRRFSWIEEAKYLMVSSPRLGDASLHFLAALLTSISHPAVLVAADEQPVIKYLGGTLLNQGSHHQSQQ